MKTFARICGTVISVVILLSCSFGQDPNLKAATYASQHWLTLLDGGHYAESWDSAATFFQQKISPEQWGETMISFRTPLGKPMSRQLVNASYETNLPDLPAGKYYALEFRTIFADYPSAIEMVTAVQEPNGQWRVASYLLKRADD